MTTHLVWLPAHADSLARLSAKRRLIGVAVDRDGTYPREGHAAEIPSSMSPAQALLDFESGPGANREDARVRWQLWEGGQMQASG